MKTLGILVSLCCSMGIASAQIQNPFKKGQTLKLPKIGSAEKALKKFNNNSPITTNFDDAIYEVDLLKDFEPSQEDYLPLDVQPTDSQGSFKLKSGLYTANFKSFCLRAGTHGPSKGDGHLYAPLKGPKKKFVNAILQRYGEKPHISQQNIQVVLWAIIAGADMGSLNSKYSKTLNDLFSYDEMLIMTGENYLKGIGEKGLDILKKASLNKLSPGLKKIIEAERKIKDLVTQNKTYKQIESLAILAGVAPAIDMVRSVTKGRWSYHPDGYFLRFFPNGYKKTRVDVYVPPSQSVALDASGKVISIKHKLESEKEVIFNPSNVVATPANRSSQRIGISPVPVNTDKKYEITFYAYPEGKVVKKKNGETVESRFGHIYLGFFIEHQLQQVKGFSPILMKSIWEEDKAGVVDQFTDESHLISFAEKSFSVWVTKEQFFRAINVDKDNYFIGVNDCVSYADNVADELGLNTPSLLNLEMELWPMGYIDFLIKNNKN